MVEHGESAGLLRRGDINARPVYEQLAGIIRDRIEAGVYEFRVPSILDLAREFTVSRGTSFLALTLLDQWGLTELERGRGYFVREEAPEAIRAHEGSWPRLRRGPAPVEDDEEPDGEEDPEALAS
jgi:DNA-binding FadR family transcriptional regulator